MGYKSKKINKSQYLKKRTKKRMYGGDVDAILGSTDGLQNNELPTVGKNITALGNLATSVAANVVAKGIQSTAKRFGIDTNKPASVILKEAGKNIKTMKNVLESPEGQQLLQNIGDVSKDVIESLEPAAEEAIKEVNSMVEKEMPIITDMAEKLVLGIPGIGTAVAAAEELVDSAAAAATAANTVAHLTETGTEALENLKSQQSEIKSVIDKGIELYNNVNKGVGNIISSAQQSVDEYGNKVMQEGINNMQRVPDMQTIQSAGGSLKKYKKESIIIGGRVTQAKNAFLNPCTNSSQMLQQYGGKMLTKRNNFVKRRLTVRRR